MSNETTADAPVAIVTGAGSGVGRATAIGLAKIGYEPVLVGRREAALRETAAMIGGPSRVVQADIGAAGAADRIVETAVEGGRPLGVLANVAGLAPLVPIGETDARTLEEVFAVNAIGPGRLILRAWHELCAAAEGGRSVVVNVSSMATRDPFPGFFAYAAAKASVNLMAHSIANEGRGVFGFAVAPGAIETEMLRSIISESQLPTDKCLTPERVAEVIVGCVRGDYDDRNGQTIDLPSP